jgi:hypothetical protein
MAAATSWADVVMIAEACARGGKCGGDDIYGRVVMRAAR